MHPGLMVSIAASKTLSEKPKVIIQSISEDLTIKKKRKKEKNMLD